MILPISFLCQLPQPPRSWDVCFFHCGLASRNSFHPTGVSLFKHSLRVGPRPFEFWNSSVRRVIGMVLSLGTLSTLLGFHYPYPFLFPSTVDVDVDVVRTFDLFILISLRFILIFREIYLLHCLFFTSLLQFIPYFVLFRPFTTELQYRLLTSVTYGTRYFRTLNST